MKIHFTQSPKIPNDKVDEWKDYKKGSIHDVSNNEAERWIRRGVAERVTPHLSRQLREETEKQEEIEKEEKKEEEIKEEIKIEEKKEDEIKEESKETITPPSTNLPRSIPRVR